MERSRPTDLDLGAQWEANAGFLIEDLREAAVPDDALEVQRSGRWQRIPLFLHIRALRS